MPYRVMFLGGVVLLGLGVLALGSCGEEPSFDPPDAPPQIPFDAAVWHASRYSSQRVKMASAVMDALSLGMTAPEVEATIGKPYESPMQRLTGGPDEQPQWFVNPAYAGPKGARYQGYEIGGHFDGHAWRRLICLYFDANGRLIGKDLYWRQAGD